jgi:8-oxo-dGTP diphosphatase
MGGVVSYCYEYPRPALTADAVVFTIIGDRLQVLLIQRNGEPFKGCWALPGGFCEENEPAAEAIRRELEEETGVQDIWLEQLRTFDTPGRDPRGWVVSVAHVALIDSARVQLAGADDAADARWWTVDALPALAFDHQEIVRYGLQRLRTKLRWANIGSQLLPARFTMAALQQVHEAIMGDSLDKRNFHKRILESGAIRDTGATLMTGRRGPQPRLYEFVPEWEHAE